MKEQNKSDKHETLKELRISICFDKLNSKYNRLWDEIINITLFIFASVVAFAILFIQEQQSQNLTWLSFIIKTVPYTTLFIIIFFTVISTVLITSLIQTKLKLISFLKKHEISIEF